VIVKDNRQVNALLL